MCLQPVRVLTLLRAVALAVRRWERIAEPGGAGASARKGIADAEIESSAAYLVGSVLRGAAAGTRSGSRPRTSRVFRVVDRDGSGAAAGGEFQYDAARVRPAARRRVSRQQTEALPVLRNRFGIQPALHSGTFPGGRSTQNRYLAAGRRYAGTRCGIATRMRRQGTGAPDLYICWPWAGCMRSKIMHFWFALALDCVIVESTLSVRLPGKDRSGGVWKC